MLSSPCTFVQRTACVVSHGIPREETDFFFSFDPCPSLLSPLLFLVSQTDPNPVTPPRLGKLWVTDPTPDSLHLSWTVPEGQFDSFVVQYRDRDGRPQVVPVEGPERSIIISPLDPDHKYRFTLFGIANKKRHGPLTADGTTGEWQPPKPPDLQGG